MATVQSIIIALLTFGLLIFVHELGHYIAAKRAGIKVNEFAMGMGPVLFSFTKGETRYSIRAFPIGGFVAVEGEDGKSESEDNSSSADGESAIILGDENTDRHKRKKSLPFQEAKLSGRFIFVLAGSAMNLLLGFIIVYVLSTQQTMFTSNIVASFGEDAASSSFLQVGDEIVRVNGSRVRTGNDMFYEFSRSRTGLMDLEVNRNGETIQLPGVQFDMQHLDGDVSIINLDFRVFGIERTPQNTLYHAFNRTVFYGRMIWGSLVDLVTGRYNLNHISGPVGITQQIGEVAATRSWGHLFEMMALITINLGIFNLLPIPALDGGRLMFLLIELVRRRPINPKYEGYVHAAGFVLLIGLIIVVTLSDIIGLVTA